ncbi:hypothetical protein EYF80_050774 [Liparis tanakae]|uniref:Uncharacterized protein n=1 Tax=Liparis tanakae TaxID=230148 RepID=A0A4Z2FF61_9TELE|nr:hypothetical protein EYF80_050774 [Liparis tanakae]
MSMRCKESDAEYVIRVHPLVQPSGSETERSIRASAQLGVIRCYGCILSEADRRPSCIADDIRRFMATAPILSSRDRLHVGRDEPIQEK